MYLGKGLFFFEKQGYFYAEINRIIRSGSKGLKDEIELLKGGKKYTKNKILNQACNAYLILFVISILCMAAGISMINAAGIIDMQDNLFDIWSKSSNSSFSDAKYYPDLSIEERVMCQKAIEEVYWQHRIWPKENSQPKPSPELVLSEEAIRAKVADTMRKSNALEYYWKKPITGAQLQAEMDRMAKNTKQPAVLKEIFYALHDDPHLIAECLARPALVDRFIQSWYAFDERFHGELKKKAQADLIQFPEVSQMNLMSGNYSEIEWVKSNKNRRRRLH